MLNYSTEKVIVIQNVWIRIGKLFIQCLVLGYIAWNLIHEGGYQKKDVGFGFAQAKIKGAAYSTQPGNNIVVWDEINVVTPAEENDAAFVITNYHLTKNQSRSICPGNDNKTEYCTTDSDCKMLRATLNGIEAGTCDTAANYCFLHAWCPVEENVVPDASTVLQYVGNFTMYMKNYARWPNWKLNRNTNTGTMVPGYNFWTVAETIEQSGYTLDQMSNNGGALGVITTWNCNFDRDPDECQPKFTFIRLDDPTSTFSSGFNYRFANFYRTGDGDLSRDLYKVYGIRFIFLTFAMGSKFDAVTLFINIGSGIGMMFIANYLSDLVCMWMLPRSAFYRNKKYMNVDDQKRETQRMEWLGILTKDQLNKAYF